MDPIPTTSTRVRTPPTLLELTNRKQLILQRINILRSKLPYNPNSTELTFRLRFPMSAEQMNDISRELNALTNELRVTERQIASTNSQNDLNLQPVPTSFSQPIPSIKQNAISTPLPSTNSVRRHSIFTLLLKKQNLLQKIGEMRAALPYDPDSTDDILVLRFPMSATQMTHINRNLSNLNRELRETERLIAVSNSRSESNPQPQPFTQPNLILQHNLNDLTPTSF